MQRRDNITHIYVEHAARDYADTAAVLARYPDAVQVPVSAYGEVVHRGGQDFQLQKRHPKLILAVQRDQLLYQAAPHLNSFGQQRVFYTTQLRNCVYNCDYCFLQGMHPSGYTLLFVNGDQTVAAVDRALRDGPLYLCASYVTDLLGAEHLLPWSRRWVEIAASRPELTVELRTKSDNYGALAGLRPPPNVHLVWSLTPEPLQRRYERGTASLRKRLHAMHRAAADGWHLRACFDPIILAADWRRDYQQCVQLLFAQVPPSALQAVSLGTFRMPASFYAKVAPARADTDIFHMRYQQQDGLVSPPREQAARAVAALRTLLAAHLPPARIHVAA